MCNWSGYLGVGLGVDMTCACCGWKGEAVIVRKPGRKSECYCRECGALIKVVKVKNEFYKKLEPFEFK
jgi:hypothetical protein